jgi:hypothetical protein
MARKRRPYDNGGRTHDAPYTPFHAVNEQAKDDHTGGGAGGDGKGPRAKAANRYIEEAQTLALQAKALRAALGKKGFKAALKQQLDNVRLAMNETDDELMRGYSDRLSSLDQAASDNDKAAAGQTQANMSNAARERTNAMSEAMLQGAGESDTLRAQQMSLRNWQQNQSEVNRSYFDTLSSINSSLHDLDADTRSARVQNFIQAEADKNQLWTNYYDQRSETLTQLGNTLGQMAEYYGLANEQKGSKRTRRRRKRVSDASGEAFMDAAEIAGEAHESRDVPGRLKNFEGAPDFRPSIGAPPGLAEPVDLARPEGASLRRFPA